jgi:pyridoxal 5'-phosphate synthase pdxT subunit
LVRILQIGVLCIQGAISEHHQALTQTFSEMGIAGTSVNIRKPEDVNDIDAIIIPGGESTTIARILIQSGIFVRLLNRIEENNIAILGTCAGCVLLANKLTNPPAVQDIKLLQAMSMEVERNAFGRQKESFEHSIDICGLDTAFNAVFIRAPIIRKTWENCTPISHFENNIIAAKQDRLLALSFHPELTNDTRIHRLFIDMI